MLSADWLQVIRDDPRLPGSLLAPTWPAAPERDLYRGFELELRPRALEQAALRLERISVPVASAPADHPLLLGRAPEKPGPATCDATPGGDNESP